MTPLSDYVWAMGKVLFRYGQALQLIIILTKPFLYKGFKTEPSYHGNWLKQRLTVKSFIDKNNRTDRWAVKGKWVQYRVRHDGLFSLPKSVSFIALLYLYYFLQWCIEHIWEEAPNQINLLFCHNPICRDVHALEKRSEGQGIPLIFWNYYVFPESSRRKSHHSGNIFA